jgi:hypothetical protein
MTEKNNKQDLRTGLPGHHTGRIPASELAHDRDGHVAKRPDLVTPHPVPPNPDRVVPENQTTSS